MKYVLYWILALLPVGVLGIIVVDLVPGFLEIVDCGQDYATQDWVLINPGEENPAANVTRCLTNVYLVTVFLLAIPVSYWFSRRRDNRTFIYLNLIALILLILMVFGPYFILGLM